ncbi:MAG: MBL fold metallo-hydrolase [Candidatus Dormibacteraeota bacterium]|nr:MBL fold metallo-hydrolase [Candidatus Dormibacteraeota bacterium]
MTAAWTYTKGLHEVGEGAFAYLQPDGSWGWSNAGLLVDGDATLLVDTLFDLRLTAEMLEVMRRTVPQAARIDTVFNTHGNGDHWFGNELVEGARVLATREAAAEMAEVPPEGLAALVRPEAGDDPALRFLRRIFGKFTFEGIRPAYPTETFEHELVLGVGGLQAQLLDLGPAHTASDSAVFVPARRIVYTGDLLFIGGHPIMWAGPIENWIRATERLAALDADVFVPGHGPITDRAGVRELGGYLRYVRDEATRFHAEGLTPLEAARRLRLDAFAGWTDAERLPVTIASIYRELDPRWPAPDLYELFGMMAAYAGER